MINSCRRGGKRFGGGAKQAARKPCAKKAGIRSGVGGDMFTLICRAKLSVECVREYRFHPSRKWRFDYAIPEHKIALEVEGGVWTKGRHTSPAGFLEDIDKYNSAAVMGWRLFRCTPDDLISGTVLNMLKQAINGTFDPEIPIFLHKK